METNKLVKGHAYMWGYHMVEFIGRRFLNFSGQYKYIIKHDGKRYYLSAKHARGLVDIHKV